MTIVTGQADASRKSATTRSNPLAKIWEHRADYAYVLGELGTCRRTRIFGLPG